MKALVTVMTVCALVLPAAVGAAKPITEEDAKSAKTILKLSDDSVNSDAPDQEYVTRMTLYSGDRQDKVIEMKIQQKGGEKRLVRFLKPGDVKGMSVLVQSVDVTYVYLPQFNKTRRVAAHTSKQSFMGTDFTEQEMNIVRYDRSFEPELVGREGDEYVLKLTPKKGEEFAFAWIKMWIDSRDGLQTKIEYYNADNVKMKTQTRGDVKILEGIRTQTKVLMIDHIKQHSTAIEILSNRENIGLKDDVFTVRNLEWGN
jgi:outer membrane lipoprotein-sorting protein